MQRSLFDSADRPERQGQAEAPQPASPHIYTVSELNTEFKLLLESTYRSVWVEGEISNFTQPGSGHFYFSLKDSESQIRAVMWKSNQRILKWRPKNGMKVMVSGRVSVYEPRGEYQIDVLQIVPHGKGDLAAAFEQLKEKLQAEGLFDPGRKRPIPMLPKKIGIVTSRSGAAIRDMLQILNRRYANLSILLFPAIVQGEEAAPSIVEGIRVLNRYRDIDVLIVGRGGGSLEDLWPFNEEAVARAIAASRIPVISGVGHETDTTIADFVADLRAPTPSAAAELVIGKKSELAEKVHHLGRRVLAYVRNHLLNCKNAARALAEHRALAGIPQKLRTHQQTLDDFELRLKAGLERFHQQRVRRHMQAIQKLNPAQLRHLIEVKKSLLAGIGTGITRAMQKRTSLGKQALAKQAGKLDSLSPLAVLERGYSIASLEDGGILKESGQAAPGDPIRVRLHRGTLRCRVTEVEHE
ncbi:MAG TPA: exodeoxyribonuclease VII large subunit [Acidobacteriota bacterium]|nr:exodeoxyribonuclease VII large subunit [Acidobacteriota bacterium]